MDAILSFVLRHFHPLVQRWMVRVCPQTWLISVCRRAQTQEDLNVAPGVPRLSSKVAVHYGWGVWPSRAAMQHYAYMNVDPVIVRVPQVYRFFTDYSSGYSLPDGYLFMEYIPGKTVEELDAATGNNAVSKALTRRIANVVLHFQGIRAEEKGAQPGPVGGGMLFGYLWGEEGQTRPSILFLR